MRASAIGLILLVGAVGTEAAPEDLEAARACASIADDRARLACFDRAYGVGAVADAKPDPHFGDNGQLPASRAISKALPKAVTATIQAVAKLQGGLFRLTLDNGQIWQTVEADWALEFTSSDHVTISRMSLGGYQISRAGSARSVGARRVQ